MHEYKFLRLASAVALIFSKDPSTKVGAIAVGEHNNQVAFGFNGLPPGLADTPERLGNREEKYKLTLHAEENALANATFPVHGLYITHPPCHACALRILAARTVRHVSWQRSTTDFGDRWKESCNTAISILHEAGIITHEHP